METKISATRPRAGNWQHFIELAFKYDSALKLHMPSEYVPRHDGTHLHAQYLGGTFLMFELKPNFQNKAVWSAFQNADAITANEYRDFFIYQIAGMFATAAFDFAKQQPAFAKSRLDQIIRYYSEWEIYRVETDRPTHLGAAFDLAHRMAKNMPYLVSVAGHHLPSHHAQPYEIWTTADGQLHLTHESEIVF